MPVIIQATFYEIFFKKDPIIKVKTFVLWEDPTPGGGEYSYIAMENGGIFHILVVDTEAMLM